MPNKTERILTQPQAANKIEKVTTRLFPPYSTRVAEVIHASKVTPSEFTRLAIMLTIDGGLVAANERLARVEEQLIWLRKELSEAIE